MQHCAICIVRNIVLFSHNLLPINSHIPTLSNTHQHPHNLKNTLANVYLALKNDLEIIPVFNKIDLPAANPTRVAAKIKTTIGINTTDIIQASDKNSIGITNILERIIANISPPPPITEDEVLNVLISDSYYNSYRGVVVFPGDGRDGEEGG